MADNYLENQVRAIPGTQSSLGESAKNPVRHKRYISRHFPQKGGKKVFVTGGAGGIGKAIVEAFCKLNYQVALL